MISADLPPNLTILAVALVGAIPATLAAMYSRSARRELKPNGGSSTSDAVTRIEQKLDHIDARLRVLEEDDDGC